MAKYSINGSTLTAVADAIREKGGTSDALTPEAMAAAIAAIAAGGGVELPDGYAMEMGVFTPEADVVSTNPLRIQLTNTYKWRGNSGDTTSTFMGYCAITLKTGVLAAWAGLLARIGSNTRTQYMVTTANGTSTSSSSIMAPVKTSDISAVDFVGTNTYPIKAGVTYLWYVVGALA